MKNIISAKIAIYQTLFWLKMLSGFIFLSIPLQLLAQNAFIDSLQNALQTTTVDSVKIDLWIEIGMEHLYSKPEKTILYCDSAARLANEKGYLWREAWARNRMGGGYWSKGDLGNALSCFKTSLALAQKLNHRHLQARNISNIGLIYSGSGNKSLAIRYYLQAIEQFQKIGATYNVAVVFSNIGVAYLVQNQLDSADYYLQLSYQLHEQLQKNNNRGILFINFADLRFRQQRYAEASDYLKKTLPLAIQENDLQTQAIVHFLEAEIDLIYQKTDAALVKAQKAYRLATESQSYETIYQACQTLSKVYEAKKDYPKALQYHRLYALYKDSLQSEVSKNALQLFEYEHQQGEIAQLKAIQIEQKAAFDRKNLQKNWILFSVFAGFCSVSVIALLVLRSWQKLEKAYHRLEIANYEITLKNQEINNQKEEILQTLELLREQKETILRINEDIVSSIEYAQRIQKATLPSEKYIREAFADSFVLYRPKDIVSGDFYWFSKIENQLIFLAVGDCTGHGVAGAFMTLIGSTLLNQIINENRIYSPANILTDLDKRLLQTLQQDNLKSNIEITDGMDIALIVWHVEEKKVVFSGASRPLWYFVGEQMYEVKGSRATVGSFYAQKKHFEEHVISIDKDTSLYLFSDGYADQFASGGGKKLKVKNFRKILHDIQLLDFTIQKKQLNAFFESWRGNEKQTDDVLVVGIRLSYR